MSYRIRGESKEVSFDLLHPNPWNPNVVPERAMEAIRESIEEHGMIDELLVRPHPEIKDEFQVIDGEHRYRAIVEFASELGAMVPVRVIEADDAEAKKLTIIMNETRGSADKVDLAKLLAELETEYGESLGVGLPYSDSELDELVSLAKHDWDDYSGEWDSDDDGEDVGSSDGEWIRFEVCMTKEDYEAYTEARSRVEMIEEFSGDEPVQNGQAIAALSAEYLGSNSLEHLEQETQEERGAA